MARKAILNMPTSFRSFDCVQSFVLIVVALLPKARNSVLITSSKYNDSNVILTQSRFLHENYKAQVSNN